MPNKGPSSFCKQLNRGYFIGLFLENKYWVMVATEILMLTNKVILQQRSKCGLIIGVPQLDVS